MDEQTRKALELAREALIRGAYYDREPAIAGIDAALASPAAPVAQGVSNPTALRAPLNEDQRIALFLELNRPFVAAKGPVEMFAVIVQAIERAHGIGQGGA